MRSERETRDRDQANQASPESSNDAEAREARRRLVTALVTGGSVLASGKMLPDKWTRPIADSVLLPAHAQATGLISGLFLFQNEGAQEGPGPAAPEPTAGSSILDFFVAPAQAQNGVACNIVTSLLISVSGSQAQLCLGTMIGNYPGATTVSGLNLANTSIAGIDLYNMQAAANGGSISGQSECGPFTADKISGAFSCPTNVSSFATLSGASELA